MTERIRVIVQGDEPWVNLTDLDRYLAVVSGSASRVGGVPGAATTIALTKLRSVLRAAINATDDEERD